AAPGPDRGEHGPRGRPPGPHLRPGRPVRGGRARPRERSRMKTTDTRAERARVTLCLPGAGLTGAMYQIGALAALEDGVAGFDNQSFTLYLGTGSGAAAAATIAGGVPVERMYRALLDPADNFFP